jgi:hypothetical protein
MDGIRECWPDDEDKMRSGRKLPSKLPRYHLDVF